MCILLGLSFWKPNWSQLWNQHWRLKRRRLPPWRPDCRNPPTLTNNYARSSRQSVTAFWKCFRCLTEPQYRGSFLTHCVNSPSHKVKTQQSPLEDIMCQNPFSVLTRNTKNTEGFWRSIHNLFIHSSSSTASLSIYEVARVYRGGKVIQRMSALLSGVFALNLLTQISPKAKGWVEKLRHQ